MDAAGVGVILGAVGTLTAIGTLGFTIYARRVERHDRQREVAEERDAREAALDIERKKLSAEVEARAREQHADITATQGGFTANGLDRRTYTFTLRNMGPAYSKHVSAWMVDQVGTPRSSRPPGFPLAPGESHEVVLEVSREVWDPPQPVRLMVGWHDVEGQPNEELSNLTVRL